MQALIIDIKSRAIITQSPENEYVPDLYFEAVRNLKRRGVIPEQRRTQEIMAELAPLRMTGEEDAVKRAFLIAELRTNSQPLDW